MDEPGPWTPTEVGNSFTATVHDAANHGADYYRIYVTEQGFDPITEELGWGDLELVAETGVIAPGVGTPNPTAAPTSIEINAPGRSGLHVVYMIWQASHFDQSFYACSDVIFPGGQPSGYLLRLIGRGSFRSPVDVGMFARVALCHPGGECNQSTGRNLVRSGEARPADRRSPAGCSGCGGRRCPGRTEP